MAVTHRDKLLTAARECLETKGYARTTARDLVAASGTNLGSIGYHFDSKEALLNEAISAAFAEWTEEVDRVVRETPADEPIERMLAGWRAMLDKTEANRPLILAYAEALAQAGRSEHLREQMAASYERTRTTIATTVVESIPPGFGRHAETIASFVIAVVDGMTMQWLIDPDRAPTGEQLAESIRLMFAALTPAQPSP